MHLVRSTTVRCLSSSRAFSNSMEGALAGSFFLGTFAAGEATYRLSPEATTGQHAAVFLIFLHAVMRVPSLAQFGWGRQGFAWRKPRSRKAAPTRDGCGAARRRCRAYQRERGRRPRNQAAACRQAGIDRLESMPLPCTMPHVEIRSGHWRGKR
jgi:hypothetical protein